MKIITHSLEIANEIFPNVLNPKNSNHHFAFAYKRSKLLAIGQNDMRYPEASSLWLSQKFKTGWKFPSRHAEIDLISKLWGKIYIDSGIKIVVIRLNRWKKLGESKPCGNCSKILNALGVNKVYWSTKSGEVITGDLT